MNRSSIPRFVPALLALACAAGPPLSAAPAPTRKATPIKRTSPAPVAAPSAAAATTSEFLYYLCVTGKSANLVAPVNYPMIRTDAVCFYEHLLGLYPRILPDRVENGGIPQKTNMQAHLAKAKKDIEKAIPDANFAGLAVIDYEAWCPIWSRTGDTYRNASREHARQQNPTLSGDALEARAKQDFITAGKNVMLETLLLGKQLRPNAKWGFYGYPDDHRPQDMDEIPWMWENIDAVYPAFYHLKYGVKTGTPGEGQQKMSDFENYCRIMIDASKRLSPDKPIYGFVWERYHQVNRKYGEQMLNPDDLEADFVVPKALGANGLIIWSHLQDDRYITESKNYILDKTFPAVKRAYDAAVAAGAAGASSAPPDGEAMPVRATAPVRKPAKKPKR